MVIDVVRSLRDFAGSLISGPYRALGAGVRTLKMNTRLLGRCCLGSPRTSLEENVIFPFFGESGIRGLQEVERKQTRWPKGAPAIEEWSLREEKLAPDT